MEGILIGRIYAVVSIQKWRYNESVVKHTFISEFVWIVRQNISPDLYNFWSIPNLILPHFS